MNDYIQKYGDNALQAYKKSLRMPQSLQKDKQSPLKQQLHLLPKKSTSKRSSQSRLKLNKNQSHVKLAHSKSIKHTSHLNEEPSKKGSFIQGSRRPAYTTVDFQLNKLTNNHLNVQKKKLIISQATTPKCTAPKLQINLNNRNSEHQEQPFNGRGENKQTKDKLTQRIQRSSGTKREDKRATSQSKHHPKRQFLVQIESILQEVLSNSKKTLKSLSSSVRSCFDIILMNQEDHKLRRSFLLLKQAVQKVCGFGQKYRGKYNRAIQKINSLQVIQVANLNNDFNHHSKSKSRHQGESATQGSNNKKSSMQMVIMSQNSDLRRKIHKLQKQLQYFSSQQASLMNVFGKYKNTQSQLRLGRPINQFNSDSLHKATRVSSHDKFQKRRSSQNLSANNKQHHQGQNDFAYAVEKRFSFDPNIMQINQSQANKKQSISLYSSTGTVYSKNNPYTTNYNQHCTGNRNNDVEELSEQEEGSNQQ